MKISAIKKNPKNPRILRDEKFEKLKRSIDAFPQMMELRPIVVDEDGVILGGNMRYEAVRALGMKEIPDEWVKRADELTEEQKREFVIKDNVGFGDWDWDSLANEWDAVELADWGMDVPDVVAIEEEESRDAEAQIDKAAELNKKWKVKSGDLWQIGDHRLLCGDSTNSATVDLLMRGESADIAFTDPPWNVAYGEKLAIDNPMGYKKRKIANDNLGEAFPGFVADFTAELHRVLKAGAPLYLVMSPQEWGTIMSALLDAGFHWSSTIIWLKDSLVLSRKDYHTQYEPIFYGWKEGAARLQEVEDRKQSDVWPIDRPKRSDEHPTMKPIALIERAFKNSSRRHGLAFEPFAGSGSTLLAAENTKRRCYGIELEEDYCAVILERMQTAFPELEIKRIDG